MPPDVEPPDVEPPDVEPPEVDPFEAPPPCGIVPGTVSPGVVAPAPFADGSAVTPPTAPLGAATAEGEAGTVAWLDAIGIDLDRTTASTIAITSPKPRPTAVWR
jgi:hypothetical protein